jgi:hypothetical protein
LRRCERERCSEARGKPEVSQGLEIGARELLFALPLGLEQRRRFLVKLLEAHELNATHNSGIEAPQAMKKGSERLERGLLHRRRGLEGVKERGERVEETRREIGRQSPSKASRHELGQPARCGPLWGDRDERRLDEAGRRALGSEPDIDLLARDRHWPQGGAALDIAEGMEAIGITRK